MIDYTNNIEKGLNKLTHYRDTYALIHLDSLKENINIMYKKVKKPMMAIIKANAYGHGYQQVASMLKDNQFISMFGVATLKEAIDLRKIDIKQDILVLGAIPLEDLHLAIQYNISLTLFSLEYAKEIYEVYNQDKPLKAHIKIDTGMNRLGIKTREDFETLLNLYPESVLQVDGVFTHFAAADDPRENLEYQLQTKKFYEIIDGHTFEYIHCQNSAAMMYHNDSKSNLCRIGIAMYGIDPAGEESEILKQVMSLYTKVVMVKKVTKGERIGYGFTYTANEDEFIATLPIGYADGFVRANQGREVYINGKYYPIVGRVCMDQMMIKVDDSVKVHDEVEIFGEHISLSKMAKELQTIPYEIICLLSERVEKVYQY